MTRREFIASSAALAVVTPSATAAAAKEKVAPPVGRQLKIALTPGTIGVAAKTQRELNDLAFRHKFEAVEPMNGEIAAKSPEQMKELLADLKEKKLVWAAAGLPVDFRGEAAAFRDGLAKLPAIAAGLKRAGVTRVGTWVSPSHGTLPFLANFKQHTARLHDVASVLKSHGLQLGQEYVGTYRGWTGKKYPFIHTMAEMRELIAAIDTGNVGLVLDSWHWWQAGDTVEDIFALKKADVVSVDLNDAPKDLEKNLQKDNERELPMATGVIDMGAFMGALQRIGYDGPVRPEPFNRPLNDLGNDEACAASSAALHKAVGLVKWP